jgi:transposase InsO family protein
MVERRRAMNLLEATLMAGVQITNVAAWCRDNGVSESTFRRRRDRILAEGRWSERSRRPRTSPLASPLDLQAWVCKLRADLAPDNGADYIHDALERVAAETEVTWRVPARSTINRILSRHDLLLRNPAKRPRSSWRRFSYARPRDCYQIDATVVRLTNATNVVVFDVIDDCTRLLAACHAARSETAAAAVAAITRACNEYGAPALVLSDNGAAFTGGRLNPNGARHAFARTLNDRGTRLIHSSPYHPQTCGKVERHHQTLKKWLATQRPPTTLHQLQRLLDRYRAYYNTNRRHSALPGRSTPQQAWDNAPSHGGPQQLPIQADATVHHCRVYPAGSIGVGTTRIGVGRALRGTLLTAIRNHDHATVYDPNGNPIGRAYLTPGKTYVPLIPTP